MLPLLKQLKPAPATTASTTTNTPGAKNNNNGNSNNKTYENKKPKPVYKLSVKAVCERAKSIPGCRQVYPPPSASTTISTTVVSVPASPASHKSNHSTTITVTSTNQSPHSNNTANKSSPSSKNITTTSTPPATPPSNAIRNNSNLTNTPNSTNSVNNNNNNNNNNNVVINDALVSFIVDIPIAQQQQQSGNQSTRNYTSSQSSSSLNTSTSSSKNNPNSNSPRTPNRGTSSQIQQAPQQRDVARINIFCDTGTIAICRVLSTEGGQVRQTFRRGVSSLDVVERLLRHPPELTNIDANLVERFDVVVGANDTTTTTPNNNNNMKKQQSTKPLSPTSSTSLLQQDLELAEVGLYILQGERDKLINHLTALEEKEEQNSNNNSGGGANPKTGHHDHHETNHEHNNRGHHAPTPHMAVPLDVVAGMEFQFSLPVETMTQVEQCLHDISSLGKIVKHVATNGKSTIFLYGHGGVAYTSHIPKPLHHRLKQLQRSAPERRPCYVSLGSRERYYVGFYDGTADWRGPKTLDRVLKERMFGNLNTSGNNNNNSSSNNNNSSNASSNSSSATSTSTMSTTKSNFPQSVAFGTTYDTFFVVFGDGSWVCDGRGIPDALEDKLADRADRDDLVCVTLGPKGEWFLRAENGRMWWGGISTELDTLIQELLEAGNYLSFIDFGDDGSYFVSYDDAEETEEE